MMSGINEIGVARICPSCGLDMEPTFVMRCMGEMREGDCERCGKKSRITMIYRYTMRGWEMVRRGIEIL